MRLEIPSHESFSRRQVVFRKLANRQLVVRFLVPDLRPLRATQVFHSRTGGIVS